MPANSGPPNDHPDARVGSNEDPKPTTTPDGESTRYDCRIGCQRPLWHYGDCIV